MRNPSFEEHVLLLKDDTQARSHEEGYQERHRASLKRPWTIALVAFFVVVDIVLYLWISHDVLRTGSQSAELPIRYPYIGLDEMYSLTNVKPSRFDPLVNVPVLAAQISRAEPDKVFPVDSHQWLSDYGTLSPPDRNLHVTNILHTILQFHILDWGMEKCALTVRLPDRNALLPHEYEVNDIRGTVRLDICELDAARPLNSTGLTWDKHPKCIKHIGTIDARVGEEVQLDPFPCRTGTFRAFEVSCSPDMPSCGVNVWSNHNDTWGIYLTQYQTV